MPSLIYYPVDIVVLLSLIYALMVSLFAHHVIAKHIFIKWIFHFPILFMVIYFSTELFPIKAVHGDLHLIMIGYLMILLSICIGAVTVAVKSAQRSSMLNTSQIGLRWINLGFGTAITGTLLIAYFLFIIWNTKGLIARIEAGHSYYGSSQELEAALISLKRRGINISKINISENNLDWLQGHWRNESDSDKFYIHKKDNRYFMDSTSYVRPNSTPLEIDKKHNVFKYERDPDVSDHQYWYLIPTDRGLYWMTFRLELLTRIQ
jgi:hypothetical protein